MHMRTVKVFGIGQSLYEFELGLEAAQSLGGHPTLHLFSRGNIFRCPPRRPTDCSQMLRPVSGENDACLAVNIDTAHLFCVAGL
jgi:hypothetical protein